MHATNKTETFVMMILTVKEAEELLDLSCSSAVILAIRNSKKIGEPLKQTYIDTLNALTTALIEVA
jgi:hypothetical protein